MDELNTVNDVQEPTVEAQTEAVSEGEQPAQEVAAPAQTPEQNAWFAQQRKKAEAAEADAVRFKTENERLHKALQNYGYQGSVQDIADQLEAQKSNITVEQLRAQRAEIEQKAKEALKADPEYLQVIDERDRLRESYYKSVYEKDIGEINKVFPDAKIKNVDDIGEEYRKLRASGVSNLVAYSAVRQAKQATTPPETGAINTSSTKEKDFYTQAEADKLTPAQLDNPKVLARVIQSMTKWK